ncbi:MAG: hypothetical protein BAJALOKI2v1_170040 [Promethearchaeota archaeon]|nr:MAG: hypothetical protein BAJALOKI2v1_170040 [Candidatus Lokiarchaeota archaeon]
MSATLVLEIPMEKIKYDKKSKRLTVELSDFTYLGHYDKKTTIKELVDNLLNVFKNKGYQEKDIVFLNTFTKERISETLQLRDLGEIKTKSAEISKKGGEYTETPSVTEPKRDMERSKGRKAASVKKKARMSSEEMEEEVFDEVNVLKDSSSDIEKPKAPTKPSSTPPGGGVLGAVKSEEIPEKKIEMKEYTINLGLQYYSVMMEKTAYLFYVYFSYDVLEILDEEGKTVYKTKIKIQTEKKEPPILDLKIEGDGFEVHPLSGKVLVKEDSINPPVMVFSITPKKSPKKLLKKKEEQRRFLHIIIEYEGKEVNETILSIIVQPKQFQIKLGPLRMNVSKSTAMIMSFLSVLIATISGIYSVLSIQDSLTSSSTSVQILSNIAPGFGGILLMIGYFLLIFKKSIYPLKEKWSDFLNFDKGTPIMK